MAIKPKAAAAAPVPKPVPTSAPPQVARPQTVGDLLVSKRKQLEMALPKHMTVDRLLRLCMTEITRNPRLKECTATSLIGAVIQCAQLGLEPGGHLGHAYLVPYNNRRRNIVEAQFQIGYKGMVALAHRSGEISWFAMMTVRDGDRFEFEYGLNERLVHIPSTEKPGKAIAYYALVRFKDGSRRFLVMYPWEIETYRECSAARDDGPWETDYDAMAMKTVLRQLCKTVPMSAEMQAAVTLDELADRGVSQGNDFVIDAAIATADGGQVPMEEGAPTRIQASVPKPTSARSEDMTGAPDDGEADAGEGSEFENFGGERSPLFAAPEMTLVQAQNQVASLVLKLKMTGAQLGERTEQRFGVPPHEMTTEQCQTMTGLLTAELERGRAK